jgi:hypothetical protein
MKTVKAIFIALVLLASLTGCDASKTEYRVIDRFQIAGYDKMPKSAQPKEAQFLWLKPWTDETGKAKDLFVEKEVWDTCWMGDKYTDRIIGKDTCEHTPESKMPTTGTATPLIPFS